MGLEITFLRVLLYFGIWALIYEVLCIPLFELFLMLTDASYFGPNGSILRLKKCFTNSFSKYRHPREAEACEDRRKFKKVQLQTLDAI